MDVISIAAERPVRQAAPGHDDIDNQPQHTAPPAGVERHVGTSACVLAGGSG